MRLSTVLYEKDTGGLFYYSTDIESIIQSDCTAGKVLCGLLMQIFISFYYLIALLFYGRKSIQLIWSAFQRKLNSSISKCKTCIIHKLSESFVSCSLSGKKK
jgi:hypothetical protein